MASGFKKLLEETPKYSWVETGTAVFSFFNIVIISICAVVSVGFLVCLTLSQYLLHDEDPVLWYLCLACCLGTVLAFGFAALLYLGMYQKRPSFVLAYFIFGVVVDLSIVSVLVATKYYHIPWKSRNKVLRYVYNEVEGGYSMIIGVCVVYTFVLGMVGRTYFWLRTNRSYHQRLVDGGEKEDRQNTVAT